MFDLSRDLAELLEEDPRYDVAAYEFVFSALHYAQSVLHMGAEQPSEPAALPEGLDDIEEDEAEKLKADEE
jgi:uncharacterized repeat protein (TIGR04138 family)